MSNDETASARPNATSRSSARSHFGRCDGERAMIKAPARGSRVRPFLARHVLVPGSAFPDLRSGCSGVRATAVAGGGAEAESEWFCRELVDNK